MSGDHERGSAEGPTGPSYYDIRQLTATLERESGARVTFEVGPTHLTRRWTDAALYVRCDLRWYKEDNLPPITGFGRLGGNSGSRTLPAAMYSALLSAWDRFEARASLASPEGQLALPIE